MLEPTHCFITGTDTGIGKTFVATRWIRELRSQGKQVVPMKPVSAGCHDSPKGLRNEDAEQLIAASGLDLPYERVNRYAYAPAIAPHIAAAEVGQTIELSALTEDFNYLSNLGSAVCVEGAGGWRVPLGNNLTTADIPRKLDIPVLLVVGMRLGCLNHALLSEEAILRDGCTSLGWVANIIDPDMDRLQENLTALKNRMQSPLLWVCDSQY